MLLVIEEVNQPQHVVFVWVALGVDVLQQLDFVERLVEKVLRIFHAF